MYCTSCQSWSRRSRWQPRLHRCPTRPEKQLNTLCMPWKAIHLSSHKLDSVGMLQSQGRSQGSGEKRNYQLDRNSWPTVHLSKASPGACQSLLRGFSLAFLYKYNWVKDWGHIETFTRPRQLGGWGTCNRGCRRDRTCAWPSPSWTAAAPAGTLPSRPWSKHSFSATALLIWLK